MRSRASSMPLSGSQTADDSAQQAAELGDDDLAGLQDLLVGSEGLAVEVGLVADAGDAQDTRPAMASDGTFGHGRHPHRVPAALPQEAPVGRGPAGRAA